MSLKRNEGVIEVYKKKLEQMADLRAELVNSQELNQKLNEDIEMLQHEQQKDQMLAQMVSKMQHEMG